MVSWLNLQLKSDAICIHICPNSMNYILRYPDHKTGITIEFTLKFDAISYTYIQSINYIYRSLWIQNGFTIEFALEIWCKCMYICSDSRNDHIGLLWSQMGTRLNSHWNLMQYACIYVQFQKLHISYSNPKTGIMIEFPTEISYTTPKWAHQRVSRAQYSGLHELTGEYQSPILSLHELNGYLRSSILRSVWAQWTPSRVQYSTPVCHWHCMKRVKICSNNTM